MASLDVAENLTRGFDVIIASAFGRGNWMASHLAEQGWQVALVDLTSKMGEWQVADYDGPFGLFETERISPTQKSEWLQTGATTTNGSFAFLLPEGPLEGHGPITSSATNSAASFNLRAANYSISDFSTSYLRDLNEVRTPRSARLLLKQNFSQAWLPHLSHQVAAAVYSENHIATNVAHGIPFFAPYHLRQLKAESHEKSLTNVSKRGVKIFNVDSVSDIEFEKNPLGALNFKSLVLDNAAVAAQTAVWLLSSEETENLSANLRKKIYPEKKAQPLWCWQRFEVELLQNSISEVLPEAFSLVFDIYQQWTHANFAHFRKNANDSQLWNVWLRLPTQFRFDRNYLEAMKESLQTNLQARLKLCEPKVTGLPLEAELSYAQLKAPRFPVFLSEELEDFEISKGKNFFVSAVEQWQGLDALSYLEGQREIVSRLEHLKRIWDERALKLKEKMERRKQ